MRHMHSASVLYAPRLMPSDSLPAHMLSGELVVRERRDLIVYLALSASLHRVHLWQGADASSGTCAGRRGSRPQRTVKRAWLKAGGFQTLLCLEYPGNREPSANLGSNCQYA